MPKPNVPADNFMATIAANVGNEKLTDEQFRQFIRNTLPIVIYPRHLLTKKEEKPENSS